MGLICMTIFALTVSVFAADPPKDKKPESKWADKIKPADYPDAEAPEQYELKWDFSGENITTYTLSVTAKNGSDHGSGMNYSKQAAKGNVVIKAKGNKTASIIQKNMEVEMTINAGGQERKMSQKIPTTVVAGMLEDSRFDEYAGSKDPFRGTMFPLPSKSLSTGEKGTKPATMPVGLAGSLLTAKGQTTTTLRRFVKTPDGSVCAEIEVLTVIEDVEVPEEVDGKCEVYSRSHGIYYFDTARREFHSGKWAGIMTIHMEVPGFDNKMNMLSDTYAEYQRQK